MLAVTKTLSTVSNRNLFSREGHLTDQREDPAHDISARYRNVSRIQQKDETLGYVCRRKHSRLLSISWRFSLFSQTKQKLRQKEVEPGQLSWYSDSLRAGRSGDRIPVEARFSAPVQTGSEAHPASYTMGTGSFPGVKGSGRGVDHPHHLTSRLKKEESYTSTPPLGLRDLLQGELYLHLYSRRRGKRRKDDEVRAVIGEVIFVHPPAINQDNA